MLHCTDIYTLRFLCAVRIVCYVHTYYIFIASLQSSKFIKILECPIYALTLKILFFWIKALPQYCWLHLVMPLKGLVRSLQKIILLFFKSYSNVYFSFRYISVWLWAYQTQKKECFVLRTYYVKEIFNKFCFIKFFIVLLVIFHQTHCSVIFEKSLF